jgi:hypothetical protein
MIAVVDAALFERGHGLRRRVALLALVRPGLAALPELARFQPVEKAKSGFNPTTRRKRPGLAVMLPAASPTRSASVGASCSGRREPVPAPIAHACEAQFIYVLRGWLELEFEDGTRTRSKPWDAILVPGGMSLSIAARPHASCYEGAS